MEMFLRKVLTKTKFQAKTEVFIHGELQKNDLSLRTKGYGTYGIKRIWYYSQWNLNLKSQQCLWFHMFIVALNCKMRQLCCYKLQQILLQNLSGFLLQNATACYKTRLFLCKMQQLLQIRCYTFCAVINDDDVELFLWNGWPTNGTWPYFQLGPLLEIFTIANLGHSAIRIWSCTEPKFRLCWIKGSSDNHYAMAPCGVTKCHCQFNYMFKVSSKNTRTRCEICVKLTV